MGRNRFRIFAWVAAGAAVVALGVVTWFFQRDIQQARERIASGSEIAQSACGPIEYAVAGDGPPVLVSHGAGGGFDQGLDIAAPLVARGFRVIAVSRFGYLRTPLPADGSAAAQADAHACLLDALRIKRVAMLGISAGAPSAVQFALRHPERTTALVLLVPGLYAPARDATAAKLRAPAGMMFLFETALRSDFLFWAALKLAPDSTTRSLLGTNSALVKAATKKEQARIETLKEHLLPVSARRDGLLNDFKVMSSLKPYDLKRIAVPVLALSAPDDLYQTYKAARYAVEQIPGARFVEFPDGGHMLVGHGEEVQNEIARFLK